MSHESPAPSGNGSLAEDGTPGSGDAPADGSVCLLLPEEIESAAARPRRSGLTGVLVLGLPIGLLVSLACHLILILWGIGLFNAPKPYAAVPSDAIAVELVPGDEAEAKAPEPAREQADQLAPPPAPAPTPAPSLAQIPPLTPPKPDPAVSQPQSASGAHRASPAPVPANQSHPQTPPPPPPDQVAPSAPAAEEPINADAELRLALAARLADALQIPIDPPAGPGDTRPADAGAKLERDIIAQFKAHLNKCWVAPPGGADARRLKVLIRVALKQDGTLAEDPMLIQAVASAGGPALVQSAMRALRQCMPYSFLPRDKYKEWRVLDLGFSPEGIL